MDMPTIVYFDGISNYGRKPLHIFRTVSPMEYSLKVISFEDGIATVAPNYFTCIQYFAEIIAGCFASGSNFRDVVIRAFNCDKNTVLTGIKFDFNKVILHVTKENANKNQICKEYRMGLEEVYKNI